MSKSVAGPWVSEYNRLRWGEKADRAALKMPRRVRFRCSRCRAVVEDRDREGHYGRCWADVVMAAFERVA